MYSKDEMDKLYNSLCTKITISDDMFEMAKKEYEDLSKWIDKKTPEYKARIYTQGSFALGTVIKPLTEEDDYDIDLVIELNRDYGLTAEEYKKCISKEWLTSYRKHSKDLVEKRRCWHVEYDDVRNFHMDVVPSYKYYGDIIKITNQDEKLDRYTYISSNPNGYITWFFNQCDKVSTRLFDSYSKDHRVRITETAEIQNIKRNKIKNPLQKAIILLKRHRDLMFKDDVDNKPISIIITTLAALSYNDKDSICEVLEDFFLFAPSYLANNRKDGVYQVLNPVDRSDNFANKWVEFPEREEAFFKWLANAKKDLSYSFVKNMDRVSLGKHILTIMGERVGSAVFEQFAKESRSSISLNETKVDSNKGTLSKSGNIAIPLNHHHHED